VPTAEVAKLFGRFSEKTLYLEKEVGVCCHSACSDCEWRTPDGGYRFDILKATAPKWLPCYLSRDFGDERGCHVPAWSGALLPDGAGSVVSRADFEARVVGMPFDAMPMGPKGTIKSDASQPSAEALDLLWEWLCDGKECAEVEAEAVVRRFQEMSLDENRAGAIGEGPDMLVWKEFAKGLGAAPFERF